jgi:hypothetical protein
VWNVPAVVMAYLRDLLILWMGLTACFARTLPERITVNHLRQLDGAVEQFQLENGRVPTEREGLVVLSQYLKGAAIPIDPWGNAYVYRAPGARSTNTFEIYSKGQDGVSKTGGTDPDDINLWDPTQKWREFYSPRPIWPKLAAMSCGFLVLSLVAGKFWRQWIERGRLEST